MILIRILNWISYSIYYKPAKRFVQTDILIGLCLLVLFTTWEKSCAYSVSRNGQLLAIHFRWVANIQAKLFTRNSSKIILISAIPDIIQNMASTPKVVDYEM